MSWGTPCKFDKFSSDDLYIFVGRAGRYGSKFPVGEVTCLYADDLPLLHSSLKSNSPILEVIVLLLTFPTKWLVTFWMNLYEQLSYICILLRNFVLLNMSHFNNAASWTISILCSHLYVFTFTTKNGSLPDIGRFPYDYSLFFFSFFLVLVFHWLVCHLGLKNILKPTNSYTYIHIFIVLIYKILFLQEQIL